MSIIHRSFRLGIIGVLLLNASALALAGSTAANGANAQAVHALGQTGVGVNVGLLASNHARVTHEAFQDANGLPHAFDFDFTGDGYAPTLHDSYMAGIVASRGGVLHPDDIGVAPGSDIYSARLIGAGGALSFSTYANAFAELVVNQNCRVMMTGIALTLTPNGESQLVKLYDYYAYQYDVVFAHPAGNDPTTIYAVGDAYNGITTGGLRVTDPDVYRRVGLDKTGTGPTADGRRKPEVCAPSQFQTLPSGNADTSWGEWTLAGGQTSFSTPHTAGLAALLLGHADGTPDPDDHQDELIRAVICNSAFPNIRDRNGVSTTLTTYHNERGYGRVDALAAYNLLNAPRLAPGAITADAKGWAFENLPGQSLHTYTITALRRDRLVVTLAWDRRMIWTDQKTGVPPRFNGLIDDGELSAQLADLDLEIYEPGNPTPLFTGLATNDNLEQVDLSLTVTGDYAVIVTNNSSSESPDYALAFQSLAPLPGDVDLNYTVDMDDLLAFVAYWLANGPDLDADFQPDGQVDGIDFTDMVANWLLIDPRYFPY